MSESASLRAARYAQTVFYFMNLMACIACPRVVAKSRQMPTRDHVLEHIDAYLAFIDEIRTTTDSSSLLATEPYVLKLREICRQWTPSSDLPDDILQNARAAVEAFGFPAPPGGWDEYDGSQDNDPQAF